ncbi:Sensory histidine kinase QseC [hydrothermal vent metagenome]|uniref:histidine kinase n=1 Tax=hydrothermal vent metagenome TaxID=652676 RepID=A0A3B1A6E7_9ZZZZ|nr:ATP-binding protein [Gammaproteobacteria bacterium]
MRPRSIRWNLLLLVLGALCLAWVVISFFIYYSIQHEIEEVYDAQLAQNAKLLASLVRHELEESHQLQIDTDDFLPLVHRYEAKISFVIYYSDGTLMTRSPSSTMLPVNEQLTGFEKIQTDGEVWYTYNLRDPKTNLLIQTAQRHDVRAEMVAYINHSIVIVMLAALPFITFLLWVSIGRGLRPLVRLADTISGRSIHQLDQITVEGVPTETRPIIVALNSLFDRLYQAFEKERRFTADAAHELRTPLAGIKTQAQVAMRSIESEERQQAIMQVITGVERSTKLVNQLLILARVDESQHVTKADFDLKQLCAAVIGEKINSALIKHIDISLQSESDLRMFGNEELIRILIVNLVSNAIRYTPDKGRIIVSAMTEQEGTVISVKDSGPGIPESLQTQVFDRFKRGEHPDIPGSGLGLSIVSRIAELHWAKIELGQGLDGAGLDIKVVFPELH